MHRICHMTSAHTSLDTRIFYKECVSLAKAGYKTYLVAPGESFERDGVHIVGVGEKPTSRFKRMTETTQKVYRAALALNADLYHFHDPELLPYGLKLKNQGKYVIFDSHENTLEQISEKNYIPKPLCQVAEKLYRIYAGHVLSRFNCIISVTPHICDQIKEYNPLVYMITNYPFLPQMSITKKDNHTNLIRLGFAGGVTEQWSHIKISEALSIAGCATYEVWGDYTSNYHTQLNNEKSSEYVTLHGKLPHTEVSKCLAPLDAGLALCQYSKNSKGKLGTLGNTKIFEYMAVGLPVICTDFILWQEIIDRYHCGICVDPSDVQAIADAIIYLRDHPEEAREMGQNGRRAVLEEFNWETQERILLELYDSLYQSDYREKA